MPPLRLSSHLPQRLETGVLSPSMFTFQRDDFQVLEKDNSCGKTDKRLENIYIQLKQTEFTIANLLKKMLSKFYIKRGRGPLVRKKPV